MDWYAILVFVHILGLVFWLGTDIGVFVIGKFAQSPEYSVEQRLLLLKILVIVDKFPRFSMIFTLATGFQLGLMSKLLVVSQTVEWVVWAILLLWLIVVTIRLTREEHEVPGWVMPAEKTIGTLILLLLLAAGITSVIGDGPLLTTWLALKVLFFAGIFIAAILLEKAFGPALVGFTTLATEGSSEQVEKNIRSGMDKTYFWVICIYIFVFLAALFGVLKPAF
ncbi:MAG: hypothetical protein AAF438_22745 [Pseudomonadota bacterium]